jgi:hypothetical protein
MSHTSVQSKISNVERSLPSESESISFVTPTKPPHPMHFVPAEMSRLPKFCARIKRCLKAEYPRDSEFSVKLKDNGVTRIFVHISDPNGIQVASFPVQSVQGLRKKYMCYFEIRNVEQLKCRIYEGAVPDVTNQSSPP